MVKHRLIASLLVKDGFIVQSIHFRHPNVIGNAITAVDFFNTWTIDEIVILDISPQTDRREEFVQIIERLSQRCFVPLTVGGWLRSVGDIRQILAMGADKVTVNTAALERPGLIAEAAECFGSQCIVVSIDVKREHDGTYRVYSDRGKRATGRPLLDWALEAQEMGAGEIYLTSIDRDGSRQGYDLEMVQAVTAGRHHTGHRLRRRLDLAAFRRRGGSRRCGCRGGRQHLPFHRTQHQAREDVHEKCRV